MVLEPVSKSGNWNFSEGHGKTIRDLKYLILYRTISNFSLCFGLLSREGETWGGIAAQIGNSNTGSE